MDLQPQRESSPQQVRPWSLMVFSRLHTLTGLKSPSTLPEPPLGRWLTPGIAHVTTLCPWGFSCASPLRAGMCSSHQSPTKVAMPGSQQRRLMWGEEHRAALAVRASSVLLATPTTTATALVDFWGKEAGLLFGDTHCFQAFAVLAPRGFLTKAGNSSGECSVGRNTCWCELCAAERSLTWQSATTNLPNISQHWHALKHVSTSYKTQLNKNKKGKTW